MEAAETLLADAKRGGVPVYLSTTAPDSYTGKPLEAGPLSAEEALSMLKGLTAHPWFSDFKTLLHNINNTPQSIDTYFFSDGTDAQSLSGYLRALQHQGQVFVMMPRSEHLPLLLSRGADTDGRMGFIVHAPKALTSGTPVTVQAEGQSGHILGIANIVLSGPKTDVFFGYSGLFET